VRSRLIAARILVVLGAIVALIGAVAGYVRYQVFDDSTFRSTSADLIADPVIRDQVASTLVDELFNNVDVAARLDQQLPAQQKGLAAPIAVAIRSASETLAKRLLARPRPQQLWVESTSRAQKQLERVLDDRTTFLQTEGGYVVLDLRPLVVELGDRVAIISKQQRLTGDRLVIRIMKADQLETAQNATKLLKTIGPWLGPIALLLWAIAIWLARGRRRIEVRAIAISLVVVGLLILVVRGIGGRYVTGSLVKTESVKPAANHAWEILTSLLADGGWTLIGLGAVALAGTWLVGPGRRAGQARNWLSPVLERWEFAYGIGALALLLVTWWGPTAQTRRPVYILVLAILLAVGIEAVRRVAARTGTR
jgi:hypothetical protein